MLGSAGNRPKIPNNIANLLANGSSATACEIVREDLGMISKGSKLTDFEQKAWAIGWS